MGKRVRRCAGAVPSAKYVATGERDRVCCRMREKGKRLRAGRHSGRIDSISLREPAHAQPNTAGHGIGRKPVRRDSPVRVDRLADQRATHWKGWCSPPQEPASPRRDVNHEIPIDAGGCEVRRYRPEWPSPTGQRWEEPTRSRCLRSDAVPSRQRCVGDVRSTAVGELRRTAHGRDR